MRILYHAVVELDLPDGHAIHTREVCEALSRAGHEVVLLAPRSGYGGECGVRVEPVGFFGFTDVRLRLYRFLAGRRAAAVIDAFDPEVIIDKGTPLLHELTPLARRRNTPLVVELNGVFDPPRGAFTRQTFGGVRRAARNRCLSLMGVSPLLGDILSRQCGIDRIPFIHFENGANPTLFRDHGPRLSRSELGVPDDAFLIGFAGSANPHYDFATVLEGAALAARSGLDLRLFVCGPQGLQTKVRELAVRFGFQKRLILRGPVPYPEVPALVRSFDVGPVVWHAKISHMAPTAMKLKELLLLGVPVVCNLPAAWNGWGLASSVWGLDPVEPGGIALAFRKIAHDQEAARVRARRGGDLVRQRHTWDAVGLTYGAHLQTLAKLAPAR